MAANAIRDPIDWPVLVIARRHRLHGKAVDQYLCISRGESKRYKIYTADDDSLNESYSAIAPVEFDSATDLYLNVFLIESFWRMHVDIHFIDRWLRKDFVVDSPSFGYAGAAP
jgi:hypothetical protein